MENYEEGMARLAAFLGHDESFGMYRAFFPETSDILLRRMIRLGKLADKKHELDTKDAASPGGSKLTCIEIGDEESDKDRLELEAQMYKEFSEYCMIESSGTIL